MNRPTVEAISDGWRYTAPLPEERRVVAFLTDADLPAARIAHLGVRLAEHTADTDEVGAILAESEFTPKQGGFTAAHSSTLDRCIGDGWIAAGDASKLAAKTRDGALVRKRYHPPATPCQRLLADPRTNEEVRRRVHELRASLSIRGSHDRTAGMVRDRAAPQLVRRGQDDAQRCRSSDLYRRRLRRIDPVRRAGRNRHPMRQPRTSGTLRNFGGRPSAPVYLLAETGFANMSPAARRAASASARLL